MGGQGEEVLWVTSQSPRPHGAVQQQVHFQWKKSLLGLILSGRTSTLTCSAGFIAKKTWDNVILPWQVWDFVKNFKHTKMAWQWTNYENAATNDVFFHWTSSSQDLQAHRFRQGDTLRNSLHHVFISAKYFINVHVLLKFWWNLYPGVILADQRSWIHFKVYN